MRGGHKSSRFQEKNILYVGWVSPCIEVSRFLELGLSNLIDTLKLQGLEEVFDLDIYREITSSGIMILVVMLMILPSL